MLIVKNDLDASNTEHTSEASDAICDQFLDPVTANTVQAQTDAEAYGYNFANTYTYKV